MRQNNNKNIQYPEMKFIEIKHAPKRISSNQQQKMQQIQLNLLSNNQLQDELNKLRKQTLKSQSQFMSKQKLCRIQIFKNQKLKDQLSQIDKQFGLNKIKLALQILQKNKDNKESPIFYNQNGLCPFELLLLDDKKIQMMSGFVCMICFQDIEKNQQIIQLPCEDAFHKQCAFQHLLGSKLCPNCNEIIDSIEYSKQKCFQSNQQL